MHYMKYKLISYAASAVVATCLLDSVSAQDDHWDGTAGNTDWNVASNWSLGVVPPNDTTYGTNYIGNVWLDPANGDSVVTIPAGDVETPGVPLNGEENYNTIFGPEFGVTLNVYGSLSFDWTIAPYSPNPTERSIINMYSGSSMSTKGASANLGDGWWSGPQFGCYSTMNLYGNAQYSSTGGAGMWFGAHLNIYDTATFLVNGYLNMDTAFGECDGTRSLVLGGGTLLLPEGTISGGAGPVTNLIQRGILRPYGKGYDTNNDVVIFDNGANTIVTNVPLGGALEQVYFQPLVMTNVNVGTFQQATLVGNYPSVTGVLLSSAEPGLDPALFPHPLYASSNPDVATIDTNGVVTAVGIGKATFTATVGEFTSTNSVAITVSQVVPGLAHRYRFKDAAGSTTTADSVGGAAWAGTLNGDAVLSGSNLVLSGNLGSSASLPAGIVSGINTVTVEAWATFPSAINPYAYLFAFGNSDLASAASATFGDGENYIDFSPHTGGLTAEAGFGQGDPGSGGEWDAVTNGVLDNQTNVQIVAVFNPYAGSDSIYINGVLAGSVSVFNNLTDPIAFVGPTYTNATILPYMIGADPINYIGQSLYAGNPNVNPPVLPDPGLLANIQEFRIYTNALTAAQVAADHVLGPNQLLGTSTNAKLSASVSGGNLVIKWPTTSARVTLLAASTLGTGATWTQVSNALTTDGNGNYEVTVPITGSAQFFQLQ
jgi:hypothetical protein